MSVLIAKIRTTVIAIVVKLLGQIDNSIKIMLLTVSMWQHPEMCTR